MRSGFFMVGAFPCEEGSGAAPRRQPVGAAPEKGIVASLWHRAWLRKWVERGDACGINRVMERRSGIGMADAPTAAGGGVPSTS